MPYLVEVRRRERHSQWEPAYDFAYAGPEPANEDATYCRFHRGKKLEFRVTRVDHEAYAGEVHTSFKAMRQHVRQPNRFAAPPEMEVASTTESLRFSPDAIARLIDQEAPRGRRVRR